MDRSTTGGSAVARVLIARDGRYLDADAAALEILGVSLETLQAHVIGDFSLPQLQAPTRAAWQELAELQSTAFLIGETYVVRPDGSMRLIKVVPPIEPGPEAGAWWVPFQPLTGRRGQAVNLARPQQVLAAWREAERRSAACDPGTPERARAERLAEGLGALYRAALDLRIQERDSAGG